MKLFKEIGIAVSLAVLCLLVTPNTKAHGQTSNAVVTFTVPVEVPGVSTQTLPAGAYLFKALESSPDRDIIQISSPDGTHVFTTFLGVPNSRLKAPDLITVMFSDRPAADPQALKAWYCPGRLTGDQIVYEKPRAAQLAKETNEAVLSTSVVLATSSVEDLKTAAIEAVSPTGETVALTQIVDAPPMAAPALTGALAPAGSAPTDLIGGSTAAVASSPVAEPVPATESTVAAGPAIAAVPVTAPAPTVATQPAVAATPASAIDPPATSAMPATTDPAAASASTPIGEPAVTPAPSVSAEPVVAAAPVVAVAPVAPVAPPVTAAPVATVAPTVTAEPAVAAPQEVATATLPQTASLLPLIGLVGLLMLGAGFLLTDLMKRRA
jgi:hypothetical protein